MKRYQRNKIDRLKRLTIFILVLLILLTFIGLTRKSEYTIFKPFSRRIFDIDSSQVNKMVLGSGSNPYMLELTTKNDKEKLTEIINNLRYYFISPALSIPSGDWAYRFQIYREEEVKSFYFGSNVIEVNGFFYYCNLNELYRIINEKKELRYPY